MALTWTEDYELCAADERREALQTGAQTTAQAADAIACADAAIAWCRERARRGETSAARDAVEMTARLVVGVRDTHSSGVTPLRMVAILTERRRATDELLRAGFSEWEAAIEVARVFGVPQSAARSDETRHSAPPQSQHAAAIAARELL
jgi:hypothetical protein